MGRTLARTLPLVVAFTWMVIFSTCANATTYDIFSFDLKTLIGNKIIGTGTFDVADTTPGIHTLTSDLSITITSDPDPFLFSVAFATFNNSGKLTDLVGLDSIGGLKGDSVGLGGIFGHLFGLFTDAGGTKPVVTLFKITDVTVGIGTSDLTTPLPSTWIMMLFGLIGLGVIAYRGTTKRSVASMAA
jgi:hypothetical protein